MIIARHGHYTTEPKALQAFHKPQVDAAATPAQRPAKASLNDVRRVLPRLAS